MLSGNKETSTPFPRAFTEQHRFRWQTKVDSSEVGLREGVGLGGGTR